MVEVIKVPSHKLTAKLIILLWILVIVCNNVYAHVPDINNFTEALEASLNDNGVVTIEFPHLLNLIELCQFDKIYHEHYSYFSLTSIQKIISGLSANQIDSF